MNMLLLYLLLADNVEVRAIPMNGQYEIMVSGVDRGEIILYDEGGHPVNVIPVVNGKAIKPCRLDLSGGKYYYILVDSRDSIIDRGILR